MTADEGACRTGKSTATSAPQSAGTAAGATKRLTGLSDGFASALRQLTEIESDLDRRMGEFERREQETVARERELSAKLEELEQRRQQIEAKHAEIQKQSEQLDALELALAAEEEGVAERRKQLALREAELGKREPAATELEQALAQEAGLPPDQGGELPAAGKPVEGPQDAPAKAGPSAAPADPPEPHANDKGSEPAAKGQEDAGDVLPPPPSGLFVGGPRRPKGQASRSRPRQRDGNGADAEAGGSIDTADLTEEEAEKLRVLRRVRGDLSDVELLAHIRTGSAPAGRGSRNGGAQGKSKRKWWS